MDAEIQRRRTFEIIAKWIGKANGITINFQPNATPQADVKNKRITLPSNMKIENLDKVLALVFHEAGHIKKTSFDAGKIVSCQEEMNILNGCEDVRIDRSMMNLLPRVRDFYEELVKWEDATYATPEKHDKLPLPIKALLGAMRQCNGLGARILPPDVEGFINTNNIRGRIGDIEYMLDCLENNYGSNYYKEAKEKVKELTEIIFGKAKRTKTEPKGGGDGKGKGKDKGKGEGGTPKECDGNGDPSNADGEGGDKKGDKGNGQKDKQDAKGGTGGDFGLGDKFAELFEPDPNAHYALDDVSLTEQTVQAFNELLTVKSKRIINDGSVLNTDNLIAFFTGAIDELFKEVKIEKHKKSKILFLLDSSGSMKSTDGMVDNQYKTQTLVTVANKLTTILNEIREVEGINVDFLVRGFDDNYHDYWGDDWQQHYLRAPGGGTDCEMAFQRAVDEIQADKTIDGNKLIILVTDGQIDKGQMLGVKNLIMKNGTDIKALILGIGLHPQFEELLGGRNIISKDLADGEILLAIHDMLDE